jgi:hypothetical protein
MSILNSTIFQGFSGKKPCDLHDKIFINPSSIFGFFHSKMYFTGKCDGPSIEAFIKKESQHGKRIGPIG